MPQELKVPRFFLLPEVKVIKWERDRAGNQHIWCEKNSLFEVCPKCASPSKTLYDHRFVKLHDQPMRNVQIFIHLHKRRFYCKTCEKPFTEPVQGVRKGRRTTEKYRRGLFWACENFTDLKKVRKHYKCSTWLVYQTLKEHLNLNLKRKLNYPWPKTIGIDEHFFSRSKGYREFATVLVDFNNKRVREIVLGKTGVELRHYEKP